MNTVLNMTKLLYTTVSTQAYLSAECQLWNILQPKYNQILFIFRLNYTLENPLTISVTVKADLQKLTVRNLFHWHSVLPLPPPPSVHDEADYACLERQNVRGNLIFCDEEMYLLESYIKSVKPKLEKGERKSLIKIMNEIREKGWVSLPITIQIIVIRQLRECDLDGRVYIDVNDQVLFTGATLFL